MTAITDWRDGIFNAYNSAVDYFTVKLLANSGVVIGDTRDVGPAWTSVLGVSGAAVVSADATGNPAVTDAPTTGQKIVIDDIMVSSDTAMNIIFSEETSGTVLLKLFIPVNGFYQATPRSKIKLATANKKLMADASVSGNVAITVLYHSQA